MEKSFVDALVVEYDSNYSAMNTLAENIVCNVEIPVYNRLSTMSKQNILHLISTLAVKSRRITIKERILMLTLLTDAITCMIKHKHFYDMFEGNNTIRFLCMKINEISRWDIQGTQPYVKQMLKYADRIPDIPELKICLRNLQLISTQNNIPNFENVQQPNPLNKSLLKENNSPNVLKRKLLQNINKFKKIKPTIETVNYKKDENDVNQNHITILKVKPLNAVLTNPKKAFVLTDQSIILKLPDRTTTNNFVKIEPSGIKMLPSNAKPKNAFEILMNSAKSPNNKIFKLK